MAKTTKNTKAKTPVTPVEKTLVQDVKTTMEKTKKVAPKEVLKKVEEPKKLTVKEEPKKLTTKKEPKKITAKSEPVKIAAKPEPKKITAAAEPKKITTNKAVEAITIVDEKVAGKAEAKKKTEKPVAKTKKVEAKATVKPKTSKAAKVETPKATVKKAEKIKTEKVAKPKVAKAENKKASPVKKAISNKDKELAYEAKSLEECIALMQAMNVQYDYNDYYRLLMDEADLKKLEKNIIDGNAIKAMNLNFDEQGYDEDLVMVTLQKVADTMDIKAIEYKDVKKGMQTASKFTFDKDDEVNAAEYLDEFKLAEKILMIGQRKNIVYASEVSALIGAEVATFVEHFFSFAYELLPTWQYSDVKFYEDFAFAMLSQYADLYEEQQLRILLDVADLYILHGDQEHGDECYGYILRDNEIKDYIYYRYSSIYKDINMEKAKGIAYSALQYVDDRFVYYPNLMEIINA